MPAATLPISQAASTGPSSRDRTWELGRYHGALEAELNETVRDCNWLKDELKTIKQNSNNLRTMLYNPDRLKHQASKTSSNSAATTTTPTTMIMPTTKAVPLPMETAVVRYMLTSDMAGPTMQPEYIMAHGKPFGYPVVPVPVAIQRSHSCPMCTRSNKRSNSMRRMKERRREGSFTQDQKVDSFKDIGYQSTSTSSSVFDVRTPARSTPTQRRRNSAISGRSAAAPPPYRNSRHSAAQSDRSDVERALESSERKHPRSASATPVSSGAEDAVNSRPHDKRIVVPPKPPVIVPSAPKRVSPKEEANRRLREMTAQAMAMGPPPPYVAPTANGVPKVLSSPSLTSPTTMPTGAVMGKIAGTGMTPHSAPIATVFNTGLNYTPPPRAVSGSSFTPSVRASPGTPQKFPAFPHGAAAHSGPVLVPAEQSQQSLFSEGPQHNGAMPASGSQLSPHSVLMSSEPSLASVVIRVDTPNAAAMAAGLVPKSSVGAPGSSGGSQQHLQNPAELPDGVSWESIDSTIPLGKGKAVAVHSDGESDISNRSAAGKKAAKAKP